MFTNGIVSVTFRKLSIDDIIALCAENSLSCIEIGSDVHAPKDDLTECARIRALAEGSGIEIISYGTYYKLGQYADASAEFSAYIAAARALGTTNLRLWAGVKNREQVSTDEYASLINEAKLCASLAADAGMTVSFEFHGGTLTNTPESALEFITALDAPNASLYWQPNQHKDLDFNLASLRLVLPYVTTVHTFAWDARSGSLIRFELSEHESDWAKYLEILAADCRDHALLLEFVKGDSVEQLVTDAKTLNEWSK